MSAAADQRGNRPPPVGEHLYLDCFSGVAGDMFLGALLDLGLSEAALRQGLARLPVGRSFSLEIARRAQMGIEGCDVRVKVAGDVERGHGHGAAGRRYREIREMVIAAELGAAVEERALQIFDRVAAAEGKLHGVAPADVCFHEVGAVDSIVDIVGAAILLEELRPRRITCRPVPLGSGSVRCAHGVLPLPSPAALEILAGAEVEDGGAAVELCTPTGAAIVATTVEEFGPLPAGRLLGVGYGAGDRALEDRANHLRVVLLADTSTDPAATGAVLVEANIDDMSPELSAHLIERLLAAGARDAWLTPIVMKKGRPALTVAALCGRGGREAVVATLLRESTTIGLRYHAVDRRALERRSVTVDTPHGPVVVKEGRLGGQLLNVAPEFESCRAVASDRHVPLKEVYAAAIAAHRAGQGGADR